MKGFFPGLVLLGVLPSTVWGQAPAGTEFRVNTYTTSPQGSSAVASDGSGNFVIVWESYTQDGSSYGVFGQRFNASGIPQGSEFQVNTYTTGYQFNPVVASDENGNFVVVWTIGFPGDEVVARRFNSAGVALGAPFQVNVYTTGSQAGGAVASDASGNFVVVWKSDGQDGSASGVFGRRFNASGVPQASEFQVNSYTSGAQAVPSVASDRSGNFVVVWQSGQDGSNSGVFGRRFDASGAPQATEFQVNAYTTSFQFDPVVASDANGNFVVAWDSYLQDGSDSGVFGRRFNASGVPLASEFRVNSYTTSTQANPAVASDEQGNFVVIWESLSQDGSDYGVFGQRFDASGASLGSEFRVNSTTLGHELVPAVASSPDGDFVVTWTGYQDGSADGVFGQRYGDLIFEDGFQSGDLTRWSAASTDGFDLNVGGAGGMAGTSAGLQAFVNDTNALYVEDDSPTSESRYRARFYLDTNGFDPGEASSHFRTRIFIAFDDTGLRVLTLVLKRQGGAYSIEARVRRNDGTRADTGFFPILDGPHFFEVDWIRSSAPGASDGIFTFRVDNVAVSTLTLIDNDGSPVDFVRMGALSIKTGASGTLYYDQFESRRQVLIGPE